MKKIFVLLFPLLLLGEVKPFGAGLVVSNSLGLQLRFDTFKAEFYNDRIHLDHYIKSHTIEKDLSWYYAGGLSLVWHKNTSFDLRVPVGLDWDFTKSWDLWAEAVPTLSLSSGVSFTVHYTLGVRYFFD